VDEILFTSTTGTEMQELDMDTSILLFTLESSAKVSFESPIESTCLAIYSQLYAAFFQRLVFEKEHLVHCYHHESIL